jgi:peptidyl-prolyl cis-trans isomerase SurA
VASHGLTVEEYREKIRSEIERSKVINTMVRSRVHIEPLEVEALYYERFGNQPVGGEEVHLRHILVASKPQAPRSRSEACQMVEEGAERIRSGAADFPTVASEISDANPGRGGDLGWIHSRDLAGWMAPLVHDLEPGQISRVAETRFGCNLLQLVERRKFEPVTFEQAKPRLEAILMREKMEEEYTKWVESLREQTYIEKKTGFFVGDAS